MPVASVYVPSFQRVRMVKALIETVSVHGYQDTSVAAIVATARASRRTFYEHFADRDDCLLAAFDAAVWEMTDLAVKAYQVPGCWSERVRAALQAVLVFLEDEPTIASLVFVESPQAGPRVRARRAEVMKTLAAALDAGRPQPAQTLPVLTAETIVGGAITVVHTRLAERPSVRMMTLVKPLTAAIVLPYLGPRAASEELRRPGAELSRSRRPRAAPAPKPTGRHDGSRIRVTYRTLQVLAAIAETPGASNREIAEAAGVLDQGQMSKLLTRLQNRQLVKNAGTRPGTGPHEWHLTERGAALRREVGAGANGRRGRGYAADQAGGASATYETYGP
jgi:AcrR family transcriptional regulator